MNNAPTQAATGAATPVVFGSQVTVLDVASGEVLTCLLLEAPMRQSGDPRHHEWALDPELGRLRLRVAGPAWNKPGVEAQNSYLLPPGSISQQAPLGAALLGRVAGDVVRVQAPAGTLAYQVLLVVAPR